MTLISPISETKVSGVRQFCTETFVHSRELRNTGLTTDNTMDGK